MNTFDGCCGSCIHMNTNDYVSHKNHCYCTYRKQYYNLTERKCTYYEYDRYKDYYDLNRRWHIVSMALSLLQTTAEKAGLEKLHAFRTDVLEKDPRFEQALAVYDVIGPFLAGCLARDEDPVSRCRELAESCFYPAEQLLRQGENEAAFALYARMVDNLAARYAAPLKAYCAVKQICPAALSMAKA